MFITLKYFKLMVLVVTFLLVIPYLIYLGIGSVAAVTYYFWAAFLYVYRKELQ